MVHLSSETKPWSFHYTGYPHWREAADPEIYYKVTYCIGVPHCTGYTTTQGTHTRKRQLTMSSTTW